MKHMAILWAAFSALAIAQPGGKQVVVKHRVDPEWGPELQKSYYTDPVTVQIGIDETGKPQTLSSKTGLPDNVVRALAQWRFEPIKGLAPNFLATVQLTLPMRVALAESLGESWVREWRPMSREMRSALSESSTLTLEEAEAREKKLAENNADAAVRASLLFFAAGSSAAANPDEARRLRARQIGWFLRYSPNAEILGTPLAFINNAEGPLNDLAAYRETRDLWFKRVEDDPEDQTLRERAIHFLIISDPYAAEAYAAGVADKLGRARIWLGQIYAVAALGLTALDLNNGLPISALPNLPQTPFAAKARATLAASNDARTVLSAIATLGAGGRALAKAGHLPADYQSFCEELRAKTLAIFPESSASCDTSLPLPDPDAPPMSQVMRLGGKVQGPKPVKQPEPQYPSDARSRGIQGTIHFSVIVGTGGRIESPEMLSGPLAFYESAKKALSKWEFKPAVLNGQPVRVAAEVEVNYALH